VARLARALLLLAGIGLAAYVVYEIGLAPVWAAVRTLSWRLAIVLVFPYSLSTTLDTVGWRFTFHPRPAPFVPSWLARIAGEAVNATTPTASVGGEPVKAFLLRRWVPLPQGLASVVLDKTTMVMAQGAFLVVGLTLATLVVAASPAIVRAMSGLLVVEALAVGGFVLAQLAGMAGRGGRLLARFGFSPGATGQEKLDGLDRSLAGFYRERPRRLIAAVFFHLLSYLAGSLEIYLVLNFLGLPVSLVTAVVMESFGSAVKFASFMVPASLGALEGGNVAIFAAFGLGGGVGLAYTLIRRLREATWALAGFMAWTVLSRRAADPPPPA
jgi:putative membrane protein